MTLPPIICRTLTREYRLHLPSELARQRFGFIATEPVLEDFPLEIMDLPVIETEGFYRLELPNGVLAEGTSSNCLDLLHGQLMADLLDTHAGQPAIHGATVIMGGKRLLIAGGKGAGKSTLAMYLLSRGHDVEGDEHLLVLADGVVARPRTLRVKPDTLALLAGLPAEVRKAPAYRMWNGALLHAVRPSLFGRPWRISRGRLDGIVFAEANHGGRSYATPLAAEDAFARLIAGTYFLKTGVAWMAGRLRALAASTPAYLLRLGDLPTAEWHLGTLAGLDPRGNSDSVPSAATWRAGNDRPGSSRHGARVHR